MSDPVRLHRTVPAPPIRMVHLGLGNFFRAHQAWYTALAPDADQWGIAAFTGRSPELADALTAQGGLYTLITRAADGDSATVLGSISSASAGTDHAAWLKYLASADVCILSLTVTEAGYVRASGGGLDLDHADVQRDLAALRRDRLAQVLTVPARVVAGLAARRASGVGGLAVVSCDNLPRNGSVTELVITQFALLLDAGLAGWMTDHISFVTTMVDRITPATTALDATVATELTGLSDAAPVVTEPFSEWVLCGDFPAGRPAWDAVGARFVDDIELSEQRKLWLLNGGHSLLAYAGSARGHRTIADAVGDPVCRGWLQEWWDEACAHLALPGEELATYREALLARFSNPRIRHLLAQIGADGSQKLPVRIVPTIHLERERGRLPVGALRALAAWINHLRGAGAPVKDTAAAAVVALGAGPIEPAVAAVLGYLDPRLAGDHDVVDAVVSLCRELPNIQR